MSTEIANLKPGSQTVSVAGGTDPEGLIRRVAVDDTGKTVIASPASNLPTVDASTGGVGATAPLFAQQIAAEDPFGKLQPLKVDVSGNLLTSGGGGGGGGSVTQGTSPWVVDGSGVTQPVSGSVAVTNFPATYDVVDRIGRLLGHVTVDNASIEVTGTFWQATQPVSLASAIHAIIDSASLGTVAVSLASLPVAPANTGIDIGNVGIKASQTVGLAAGSQVIGHVIVDTAPSTAITLADGADTTLGAKADAKSTATDVTPISVISILKQISASVQAPPSQAVTNAGTFAVQAAAVLGAETTKVIGTVNISSGQSVALATGSAVIGHVVVDSGAVTAAATLAAETTKVIGTVNIAGSQTVGLVAGTQVIGHVIVDTAPSTAVTNTGTFAVQAAATLAAETTKVIGTVNIGGTNAVAATLAAETTKVIGTVNVASSQTIAVTQGTPASLQATVTPIALTKGTQGATGFSTQDLKDAGRTYVTLSAQLIAGVTSEALATFTKNVNGTTTTAQTAYTITSGKTFRIQAIFVRIVNTTTVANNCTYNVRVAGSVSASSAIVASCGTSAIAAVSGVIGMDNLCIPDGMEIKGDGTLQIGVSHLENVTTASISSFTLVGYEY